MGSNKMTPKITLEEHFISDAVRQSQAVKNLNLHMFPPKVLQRLCSLSDDRVADMDDGEVSIQVVSHIPETQPADVCRKANLEIAEAVRQFPRRYAAFAFLPMADPAAAAAELDFCVKELGFVGTLIPSHAHGTHYDGEEYRQFWVKAQELDVAVYLHPTPPSELQRKYYSGNYPAALGTLMAMQVWGWHADVAVHVLRLYASGLFDQYPKTKLVIGHMGEMMPFMLERIDVRLTSNWGSHRRGFPEVWAENLWITTSGMFYLNPMSCLLHAVSIDRILYSVDYPLEDHADGLKFIAQLRESGMVSEEDLDKILYKNAETLLKIKVHNA